MARRNLGRPLLVGVVLTLLAVVAVVNLKTFVFKDDVSPLRARADRDPRPPADLAAVIETVLDRSELLAVTVDPDVCAANVLSRDPFSRVTVRRTAPAATPGKSRPKPRAVAGLHCAAVMFDGRGPAALIDGRRCGVGETVAGHRITAIDETGVRVVDAQGRERVLTVQPQRQDSDFKITFNTRRDTPDTHPDAVDDNEQERRQR